MSTMFDFESALESLMLLPSILSIWRGPTMSAYTVVNAPLINGFDLQLG